MRFLRAIGLASMLAAVGWAVDVNSLPAPTGYVDDFAHVIDEQSQQTLEAFCTRVDHELGVQFALVTVDSTGDTPIRDFALGLGRKWKIGDKNSRQGVLLLLAVKDHKDDIETERGIEPYITDGFAGGTLRSMRPDLRAGDYGRALEMAAQTMAEQIAHGKNISFDADLRMPPPRAQREQRHGFSPVAAIVIFLLVLWLIGRGGGGFWTGMLIGNLLGGGRRGGWGDGGGFGGGSGAGGFGGFGGGGDFGGGGASSDW